MRRTVQLLLALTTALTLAACGGGGSSTTTTTSCSATLSGSSSYSATLFVNNSFSATPLPLLSPAAGCVNTWTATNLPPGTSINPSTGVISGVPTSTGTFASVVGFNTVSASGSGNSVSENATFTVLKASSWTQQSATGSGLPPGQTSVSAIGSNLYALVSVVSGSYTVPQLWKSGNLGVSWTNTGLNPPNPTGSLGGFASTTDGTNIYLIGGATSLNGASTTTFSNAVYAIAPTAASPAWITQTTAAFSSGRYGLAVTYSNGILYASGGVSANGVMDGVYTSSNGGASWTLVAGSNSVAPYVMNHCLVAVGSTLLEIGGYGATSATGALGNLSNVFVSTNGGVSWAQQSAVVPSYPQGIACTYAGGKVYITGGTNASSVTNGIYQSSNLGTSWAAEPSSSVFTARYFHGLTTINNQMIAVGGYGPNSSVLGDTLLGTP